MSGCGIVVENHTYTAEQGVLVQNEGRSVFGLHDKVISTIS